MDLKLEDRVVLVTGGSDGLGRALCSTLVDEGAKVAFCGRDVTKLAEAEAQLAAAGGDVLAVQCDVTDPVQLEHLVTQTISRFGRLDGLVNNAGRSAAKSVAETTDEDWEEDLSLKLFAAIRLIRLCLPHLIASGAGSIVNVLAIAAKNPGPGTSPTAVSRAAGMALTKSLSKEVAAHNVRANAVLIGFVESGQWVRAAAASNQSVEELAAGLVSGLQIPLGRMGRAHEFADLAAYLLSERSSYVTGTAINLDGGLSPSA